MALRYKYDTITGFSIPEVKAVCEYEAFNRWIYRGSHRRRRMRILLSCLVGLELDADKWYTTETICQMALLHDARGTSSQIISNQRIGTLFRVLIARELLEYRTVKGKREYKIGEKYVNDMLQLRKEANNK